MADHEDWRPRKRSGTRDSSKIPTDKNHLRRNIVELNPIVSIMTTLSMETSFLTRENTDLASINDPTDILTPSTPTSSSFASRMTDSQDPLNGFTITTIAKGPSRSILPRTLTGYQTMVPTYPSLPTASSESISPTALATKLCLALLIPAAVLSIILLTTLLHRRQRRRQQQRQLNEKTPPFDFTAADEQWMPISVADFSSPREPTKTRRSDEAPRNNVAKGAQPIGKAGRRERAPATGGARDTAHLRPRLQPKPEALPAPPPPEVSFYQRIDAPLPPIPLPVYRKRGNSSSSSGGIQPAHPSQLRKKLPAMSLPGPLTSHSPAYPPSSPPLPAPPPGRGASWLDIADAADPEPPPHHEVPSHRPHHVHSSSWLDIDSSLEDLQEEEPSFVLHYATPDDFDPYQVFYDDDDDDGMNVDEWRRPDEEPSQNVNLHPYRPPVREPLPAVETSVQRLDSQDRRRACVTSQRMFHQGGQQHHLSVNVENLAAGGTEEVSPLSSSGSAPYRRGRESAISEIRSPVR